MQYVPYLREENAKVQWLMSYIPQAYRDNIEFHNLKPMDEFVRNAKLCYTQFKYKFINSEQWKNKHKDKFDLRNKVIKHPQNPSNNFSSNMNNRFIGQQSVSVKKKNHKLCEQKSQ